MSIYVYGCPTIPTPNCTDCPPSANGRIRGVAFVRLDYTFSNILNPVEWESAISAGYVYVIPYTQGGLDVSPKLEDSFGAIPQRIASMEYTLNLMVAMNSQNDAFWAIMNTTNIFKVVYVGDNFMGMSSTPAMIAFTQPITDDITSMVKDNVQIKWVQATPIQRTTRVTGIFDDCQH